MSADLTERFFLVREKFCAETLNFIPSSFFVEPDVELFLFFIFVALIKSRVVLTMRRRRTTFAAAFAKNNERRKKKKTRK